MSVCDSAYSKESVFRIKLARFRRSNHGKKIARGGLGGENDIVHEIIRATLKI